MSFSAPEIVDRRLRATECLARAGLDVLVISLKEHLTYLTGHVFHDAERPAAGVLDAAGTLRVWNDELEAAWLDCHHGIEVQPLEPGRELIDSVAADVRSRQPAHAGYEGDWYALSWSDRQRLFSRTGDVEWRESIRLLTELRLVKSAEEIDVLRQAAALADAGMEAALAAAAAGVREVDVAAAAQARLAALGSEYSSFPGLVGAGERSGLYHPLPTDRRLRGGDTVEIEVTGAVRRYNSNLVRTFFVGSASPQQRALLEIVTEAFEQGVAAVEPGVPVGEVDSVTRKVRDRYVDFIPSRAGYGIELSYPPFLTGELSILEGARHVFEPGMVFSLEPSIAGFEDQTVILGCNVLVTDAGAEVLHRCTRGLLIV